MPLAPRTTYTYHVFLASPGDVGEERQHVRQFFERYNRQHARLWNVRFEVIDWENYSTTGVGRPQELITQQTLEKYRDSLALVVGIMAQRFGMPTGEAESGTEEEFNWALESNLGSGWPEIKWFFRRVEQFVAPADPDEIARAVGQWNKVRAFRQRLQNHDPPIYFGQYPGPSGFRDVLENDLGVWLADAERPWVPEFATTAAKPPAETTAAAHETVPAEFDVSRYRQALIDRFDILNFEMLDVSGAYYGGVIHRPTGGQPAAVDDDGHPELSPGTPTATSRPLDGTVSLGTMVPSYVDPQETTTSPEHSSGDVD